MQASSIRRKSENSVILPGYFVNLCFAQVRVGMTESLAVVVAGNVLQVRFSLEY